MKSLRTANVFFTISIVFIFTAFYSAALSQTKTSASVTVVPPSGIHTFPGDGQVYIKWNALNDSSLDHYIISHDDSSFVGTTTDTFFTETGLTNETSYSYVIISVDTNGFASGWSDAVPAVTRSRQDSFGYTWKSNRDLDDNLTFQWTDISSTGTPVPMSGSNENTGNYPIGFDFPFYNFQFDSFRVCTNGYISFTSHEVFYSNNYQMPSSFIDGPTKNLAEEQGNIIAPFLTELNFPADSSVFYQNFGSYLVIQYNQVNQFVGDKVGGGDDTFQIILYDDGSFDFAYLNMAPPAQNLQVGWQNYAMNDGNVVTYTSPYSGNLSDGIRFDSLLIHAEYDFSATPATVQNIFFTEENGSSNQDIMYKVPVHGILGELLQYSLNNPLDLALDMSNRKVYWMYNNVNQYVMRSDLDGHNAELIATLDSADFAKPISIDIDPYIGKIYWSDRDGYIRRMNLDGTSLEVVLPPDSISETANVIAIDPDHQMLYWADAGVDAVFRCAYDGSGITQIYSGNYIHDMKLDPGNNRIYIAEEPEGTGFTYTDLDGNNSDTFYWPSYNCNYISLDPFNNTLYFARNEYQGKFYTEDKGIIALDISDIQNSTETTVIKNLSNDLRHLSMDIPPAPIHLSAEAKIASNIVKWPASPDPLVTEYKIYRDNTPFSSTLLATIPVAAHDTMSYEDFDITIGNPYFYRITAVDGNGISSPYSVQDSVTSIGPPLIAHPQNQYAFPGDNKAYLKWSSVQDSNLAGYWIYRINFELEQDILLDSLQNGDTTYVDNGAQNNYHYGYVVAARNIYGVESVFAGVEDFIFVAPRSRLDYFGYTWSSNRDLDDPDPPVFHWTDIASVPVKTGSTPIPMTGNDENTGLYPIGFEFPFYNFKFDSFRVSTNGIISFTSADPTPSLGTEFPSGPLGGGGSLSLNKNGNYEVGNILAPYWIDMDFEGETKAFYQNMGDHIIIQFDKVAPAFGETPVKTNKVMAEDNTFQVILYDDGTFEFVYQNASWPNQGDQLIGWQDYSAYRGVTITAASGSSDYPPDIIDYENLIIRGQYDFASVDQNVPKLLMTEVGQTALMMMSKTEKTSEMPTLGSNIYRIPVNGMFGEIVNPWLGLPMTITQDFVNDYIYFYDDAFGGVMRSNPDGTDAQEILNGYTYVTSIRYNPFDDMLYFSDGNSIFKSDISGAIVDTLISNSSADVLALDNENGKIYWINTNNSSIYRANIDGSGIDSLTGINSSEIYDLEINPGDNAMYWISQLGMFKVGSPNNIFKSDLDGNNVEIILSSDLPIYSIAVDQFNKKLYYSVFLMDLMPPGDKNENDKMDVGEIPGINVLDLNDMSVNSTVPLVDIVLDMDLLVPKAPVHISADAELAFNHIKWPASPEPIVAQYNIYRDTNPYPTTLLQTVYPSKNKVGLDTLSFDDWNIEHDQKYFYRVVALDADGYSSAYSVQDSAVGIGPPDIDLNKDTFVYGATPKNTVLYDTLKVYNRGDTDLEIFTVDYIHGNEFWFSSFADLPETVIPGDSMLFYLKFTPGIGDFTDSLRIESDDHIPETDSLKIVSLSGSGFNQSPVVSQVYPDLNLNEDFLTSIGDTLNEFFSDPDGDLLGYAISMKNGTLVLASENDTVITFTSVANLFGEDSLFITADDGYGGSVKQGIKITINPVNDPPLLAGIPDVEFPEEGSAQLSLNNYLSDVDNDTSQIDFAAEVINKEALPKVAVDLTIAIDSLTHIVTFSGGDDSVGVYTVKITAKDDSDAVALDTLKVTVTQVNDPPVVYSAISDMTIIEDQKDIFIAFLPDHFSDVEDTHLDYSLPYSSIIFTSVIRGDSLFASTVADKNGTDILVVTATDDGSAFVSDTLNISITPVNDPPVLATIPDVEFPEEGSAQLHLNEYLTDVDNDTSEITFQAQVIDKEALPKIGEELAIAIDSLTHVITFSGGDDSVGVYTVMITATDDSGGFAGDTMKVKVTQVNDVPLVFAPLVDENIIEDQKDIFIAFLPDHFSDVEDTHLDYSLPYSSIIFTSVIRGDSLFVSTVADKNGTDILVVTATDDGSAFVSDTLNISITPVNDPPVLATIPDVEFPEEGSAQLHLNEYLTDVDNDTSEISFQAQVIDKEALPKIGEELTIAIDSLTHVITFSGGDDSVGVYTVMITATDDSNGIAMDTMKVTVTAVNDPPVLALEIGDKAFPEDTEGLFVAYLPDHFSDVDDASLTYSMGQENEMLIVIIRNDSLFMGAKADQNGTELAVVVASDKYDEMATDTLLVTVVPVNDAPLFALLPDVSFPEDGSAQVKLNQYVNDIDSDTTLLNFSALVIDKTPLQKAGEELTISIDSTLNVITFSGGVDSVGVYHVLVTVEDDSGATDMDTMFVEVTDVNDAPVRIQEISDLTIPEDTTSVFAAWLPDYFSDVDNKTLSYSVIQQGSSVNYFFSGDSLLVATLKNSNGTDTLFVTAEDSYHAAAHDTFMVMVLPVNDPPVLSGLPDVSFEEEESFTLKLNAFVSDVDNDTNTIDFSARVIDKNAVSKAGDDLGIVIDNDNNRITFTGQKDSTGVYTVEITANDDQNASNMDTMLVTISDVNDPPFVVTAIGNGQYPEDNPAIKYVADLATIFADVEGKPLTFTTASDSGIQVWTDSTNALWIESLPDYYGMVNVFVTAFDPLLASVTDTFIVEITNVNDAPTPFLLYTPKDRDTMSLETFASALFSWEAANDIDSDELTYEVRIANETFDTTFANISATTLTLQLDEFLEYNSIYAWIVFVSDGEFTVSATDTFGFITPYPDAIGEDLNGVPMAYKLHDNYPNPFNPSTTIRFDLPKSERVSLSIYNIAGQLVRKLINEQVPAGFHNVVWDGKDRYGSTVGTGIYIYLLHAGDFKEVKKMTLVK